MTIARRPFTFCQIRISDNYHETCACDFGVNIVNPWIGR